MEREGKIRAANSLGFNLVKTKILLIDDEPDITRILKLGLEKRGFEVETYGEPVLALSSFKPNSFDVAIFDFRLPKMSGFELFQEFKKLDNRAMVCFLTAYDVEADEDGKLLLADHRVKGFLKKPIEISELVRKIRHILENQ
jgi:DNA-binding response OmpR family regulator